jgi:hypothetical protein
MYAAQAMVEPDFRAEHVAVAVAVNVAVDAQVNAHVRWGAETLAEG